MSSPIEHETPFTRLNLPEVRRRRGVSLEAIADRTKIGRCYLKAIESEEFDVLPGCIYSVSYIRQYADAIDFSADLILALYRERMRGPDQVPEPPGPPASKLDGTPRSRLLLWLCRS
jgi:cytoskeletal protein RodZ